MISLEAVHTIVRRAGGAADLELIRLVRLGLVLARQEYWFIVCKIEINMPRETTFCSF
jgi:hypothetical protein